MKVLFAPQVRSYFRELIETLFEKEYFGFEESAVLYVRESAQNGETIYLVRYISNNHIVSQHL
ncbi:hypothetical protein M2137_000183 [Parabacteroides sp. PFB2-10]|uniref:hypothetical protein n=1 Tax=Parabacteroides sp. PFB2-10 TaxID=1742405 RepID=UPI002474225E|nr:hypothetical protein [Parabacteroides sp. PFB2-10]MDH6311433.1 hypothetical protein [Parabacteroides sp. PFB2-10]MDL2244302.1 hypothetical protein [Parabacteroides sp. OttesenSCG-928-J18]